MWRVALSGSFQALSLFLRGDRRVDRQTFLFTFCFSAVRGIVVFGDFAADVRDGGECVLCPGPDCMM